MRLLSKNQLLTHRHNFRTTMQYQLLAEKPWVTRLNHCSAIVAPRLSPRLKLRPPSLMPTLPMGESINQLYMNYCFRALQLGAARNACLSRAADAIYMVARYLGIFVSVCLCNHHTFENLLHVRLNAHASGEWLVHSHSFYLPSTLAFSVKFLCPLSVPALSKCSVFSSLPQCSNPTTWTATKTSTPTGGSSVWERKLRTGMLFSLSPTPLLIVYSDLRSAPR
jgi:hypothetical protein